MAITKSQVDKLVETHFSLCSEIMRRLSAHGDDAESAAMDGLWKAAKNYNPARGQFVAFAEKWIGFSILNAPSGSSETTNCEKLETVASPPAGNSSSVDDANEAVSKALPLLPAHYQQVIKLRFGLGGCQRMTLQEVGDEMGLTKRRVLAIQRSALNRLRALCDDWL